MYQCCINRVGPLNTMTIDYVSGISVRNVNKEWEVKRGPKLVLGMLCKATVQVN